MATLTNRPGIDEETEAWGIFQSLKRSPEPQPGTPHAEAYQAARERLTEYVTARRERGQSPFPRMEAIASKERDDYLAGLYLKPLEEALPVDALAEIDRRAQFSPEPETFRQRQVNRAFLSSVTGREIPSEHHDYVRAVYAKQQLGLEDTSEAAVFSAIKTRFQEAAATGEKLSQLSRDAFVKIISGEASENPTREIAALPERHRAAAQAQLTANIREAHRARRRLRPVVDDILTSMTASAGEVEGMGGGLENFEAASGKLPLDRRDRQMTLAMLAARLKALPKEQQGYWSRVLESAERGLLMAGENVLETPRAAANLTRASEFGRFITGDDQRDSNRILDAMDFREDVRELKRLYYAEGDPMVRATDGFFAKGGILAAGSAWTIPASLTGPSGFAAMSLSFAGGSYADARQENPDAGRGSQLLAGAVSGPAQAVVETAVNRLGVKIIGGKLPGLAGILNRVGVTRPITRAGVGAVAGGLTTGVTEYAEEAIQGGIDRFSQDLALEFSNIAPETDWKQFWTDWLTVGGAEQQDTLAAIMPFAIVGAGGGSFSHFRYGDALRKNKTLLRAVGVPEAKVEAITRTTDIAAADAAMRQAFEEGLEARTTEQKAEALAVLREQNQLLARAGIPRVVAETNGFTEEITHVFTDPVTGERAEFETEEEALEHWRDFALKFEEGEIERITEAAREGTLEYLQAEGMPSEETRVEERDVLMNTQRALKEGIITPEQLKSRIEVFVLQQGLTPTEAARATESMVLRARRFSERARDGQMRYAVELFRGADALDVYEDFSEDAFARAIDEGFADPEVLVKDIRDYEAATGQRVLAEQYDPYEDNHLGLLEALSAMSRAHVLGNLSSDMVPETTRQWVELHTTVYSATLAGAKALAADLQRAGEWNEAVAGGNVSPRLARLIADSVGMDSAAQERRLQRRMEEQLAAEAMGGFPEIQETAKGMIPHPDTLQANNHPLAGEVRRLWESLKKPTRRRTKAGRQVDRTNEANAYFLPVGEMEDLDLVRRRLNQQGFDFDTPADMLDALDSSISYSRPVYGTQSQGDMDEMAMRAAGASFSIGRAAVTPTESTQAFPGAEGSPSVIGPASFAISAFHGTPHQVDRFSLSRIGSGEGKQVFGWGLYFAQAESVASYYREALGGAAGNLYEVRLDVEPEQLLDWDRRLSETPEILAKIEEMDWPLIQRYLRNGGNLGRLTGRELLDIMGGNPRGTSEALREAGIPGIRFLDGPSRNRPFNSIRREFLSALPEDAEFDDVDAAVADGVFNAEQVAFLNALEADDWLGFEYPAQAISAALSDRLSNWDASPELVASIEPLRGESRSNFVIFDDDLISILAENGRRVTTTVGASFALSPSGLSRIEAAIAKRLTAEPQERAEFYERLRNRLAGLTQRLEDMDAGVGLFARREATDVEQERRRIQDAIAEARTIIETLPVEARGRVSMDFGDITGATTERGRVQALIRLIDRADEALERVLKSEYLEAFEKLLDLAKPDLRQNRSLISRLTPDTQRRVDAIARALELTPIEAQAELISIQSAIDDLEAKTGSTPEEVAAIDAQLETLADDYNTVDTFAALSSQSAAEIAAAYQELLSVYTRGRSIRQVTDQARRQDLANERREVLNSIPHVDQPKWSKRTADRGLADLLEAKRLGLSSFHQVMEWLFPKSRTVRDYQQRVRSADRAFTRARIDARERFEEFMRTAFNLEGRGARRRWNGILSKLSTRRDDWNIEIREGMQSEMVKLSEEQAAKILAGEMKVGWENDLIAMESLRQALADFRLKRRRAQAEEKAFSSKVIRFTRVVSRGAPSWLNISDLEAVYYLSLAAQDQYLPTLDKYGFTPAVLEKIRKGLNPQAAPVATFLRREYAAEYDRLNPVYREIYGMDMPRIRNYAPGLFESLDSKVSDTGNMDPNGNPAGNINAMSSGFTKARKNHMARPRQVNALAAYWQHIEATEYFIAYGELMRDMRAVFRNPEVRRAIEGNYGTRAAAVFSQWLDALEVDGNFRAATVAGIAELSNTLLASQSAIGLAYNVGTLFKQVSAATGVLIEMPPGEAIKGLVRAIRNPSSLAHVWRSEPIQQRILTGMNPEDKRLLDAAAMSPSMVLELLDLGRLPIAYADAAFTTLAAGVAYNYQLAEALKSGLHPAAAEGAALDAVDRVVTRTAQPATTQDKSLAELTAKHFAKFLFLFKSDPRQKFAIAAQAIALWRRGDISAGEAGRRLVWSWIMYGMLAEVMTDIWTSISRDDDDEERWSIQDYVASAIAGPIAGVPLIGSVLEYTVRATIGTKAYTNNPNPADRAMASILTDKGLSSGMWRALSKEEASLTEILAGATRDTAALAQLIGAFDSRAAIVPAGLRAARDVAGMAGNAGELIFGESTEDQARRIISQERKTDRSGTVERSAEVKRLAKELAGMPTSQREARLRSLEKRQAAAVRSQLKRDSMTSVERGLASLSKEARERAIAKILEVMPEDERRDYRQRLRELGLAD